MTTTPDANGAPLDSWQSRQWQFSIARGALTHVKRTEPQAHFPWKLVGMPRIIDGCSRPEADVRM